MDVSQYLESFHRETQKYLQNLRDCIEILKANPMNRDAAAEAVNSVHSLYGMAGTMGYWHMQKLAQQAETVFAQIRSQNAEVTEEAAALLYQYLEELERYSESGENVKETALEPALDQTADHNVHHAGSAAKKQEQKRMVYVEADRLDALMEQADELVLIKNGLLSGYEEEAGGSRKFLNRLKALEFAADRVQESVRKIRRVSLRSIVNEFPEKLRKRLEKLHKKITLHMSGLDVELDYAASEPMKHILWNLICYLAEFGIEEEGVRRHRGKTADGSIYLYAFLEGQSTVIGIRDDGNGLNAANPELKTVQTAAEALGGSAEWTGIAGEGSEITIRIPITYTVMKAFLVKMKQENYAIALDAVRGIEDIPAKRVISRDSKEMILYRDGMIPFIRLNRVLDSGQEEKEETAFRTVIVKSGSRYAGLAVDCLIGQQELSVRPVGRFFKCPEMISGAAIQKNGEAALILDINVLI